MDKNIIKKVYDFRNHTLAYEHCIFNENAKLTVMYIHGWRTNPWTRKVEEVKATCKKLGVNFYRFELIGHEQGRKDFHNCDFAAWKSQLEDIITNRIQGNIILVGHCAGGWLSLCMAEQFPERIKGVIGLAATSGLFYHIQTLLPKELIDNLKDTDYLEIDKEREHFVLTKALCDSFKKGDLTFNEKINITCPVHLIHGLEDTMIDWHTAIMLISKIHSTKVTVKLLKDSRHSMQDRVTIEELRNSLKDLCGKVKLNY